MSRMKKLREKEDADVEKRCRHIFTRGEKELPAIPPTPNGEETL
jgi:hypothetical protein